MWEQVVFAARKDLQDIDISDNNISVNTIADVLAWEAFLRAISECCSLRRLNLSNNALGAKAYEMMLKVYGQEAPVDLVLPEDLAEIAEVGRLENKPLRPSPTAIGSDIQTKSPQECPSKGSRRSSRHGVYDCCQSDHFH